MNRRARAVVLTTVAAALIVFAEVQDRRVAEGAGRYAALQRAALSGVSPAVTVDAVMRPAVARSVREGLLWSGVVLAAGLVVAAATARRGSVSRRSAAEAER